MSSDQDELAGLLGSRKGKSKADPHLGRKKTVATRYAHQLPQVFDAEPYKSTAEMIESLQPMVRKPGQPWPTIPHPEVFDQASAEIVTLAKARRSTWAKPELRVVVSSNLADELAKAADGVRRAAYQQYVSSIVKDVAAVVLGKTAEIWWPEMTFGPKTQIGPTDV